ncbi:hypothetical protein SAMN04490186_1107 [Pseudomonas grimontii]|jgi:hypothetical protein|uniref:Uncharacterized protein n=1 Tax=Pseudomonas grimontii TaxID=129847 RepID=A0A1H1C3Q9_9PSED|nr:hypothetical protein [Pseudomonas grimontii]TWR69308.1 hypothetical protein FIV39_06465 [Pseudomonas grimontii]SDQ58873.1 hypothetical protein SAMN04490186_1107 [Pseudomonas grimontii]
MNIRTALWTTAACTLATLTGCTNGQGPNSMEGIQRFENKTSAELVVAQGAQIHSLAPGQSLDLQSSARDIHIMRRNSVGTIDRVILRYNPGNCSVAFCFDIY